VWCFLTERFVPADILCLALGIALKPHDAGLVWLYFLLTPVHRKRALQTFGLVVVMTVASLFWVSSVAPHWIQEMRSNLATLAMHGGPSDPGPDGLTTKTRTMEEITDLQAVVSVFKDDPGVYNGVGYAVCGMLLLFRLIATLRSRYSQRLHGLRLRRLRRSHCLSPIIEPTMQGSNCLRSPRAHCCGEKAAGEGRLQWR
jgi:hypothetical protein